MNRLSKYTIERRKAERRESIADEIIRLQNAVNLLTWERDQLLHERDHRSASSRSTENGSLAGSEGGAERIYQVSPLHQVIRMDHCDDEC